MAPAAAARPDGPAAAPAAGGQARLLGERIIPHGLAFRGTTVGGLSGIDRNPRTGEYVMISDDRSVPQPARFHTARIDVDGTGVRSVAFTGTRTRCGSRTARSTRRPAPATARPWTRRNCGSTRAPAGTGGPRRATGRRRRTPR
ncbi:esterase-like activity of phytase family protein [Streptomyces sp. NPDC038707]|uniref:esterase-like activity of phytase family protein n=1 Tax=Streptomyces sp. NPDC038707 TaxID=3154329 RepID=UPI0033E86E5D